MAYQAVQSKIDANPINISSMPKEEKLKAAIERAIPKLPAEIRAQVAQLIKPEALAVMVTVLAIWAGAHFFGVGEIADVVLLIVGYAALGGVAMEAGKALYHFGDKALNARTEIDLDAAADLFAKAVTLVGVQVVMIILLKKKPETFKHSYIKNLSYLRGGSKPPERWFYKPQTKQTSLLPNHIHGSTTRWGDVDINANISVGEQAAARFHELVHQILTPKLYILRGLRAHMRLSGYSRSYILRYLEEALAETYAQLRISGFSGKYLLEGILFPIDNGYEVTIACMRHEAAGILLGPINVGGMLYNVFVGFNTSRGKNK